MLFTVFSLSITFVVNTAEISSFICQAKAHTRIYAFLLTYIVPVNPVIVYSYFLQLSVAILSTYVIRILCALKQIIPYSSWIFFKYPLSSQTPNVFQAGQWRHLKSGILSHGDDMTSKISEASLLMAQQNTLTQTSAES